MTRTLLIELSMEEAYAIGQWALHDRLVPGPVNELVQSIAGKVQTALDNRRVPKRKRRPARSKGGTS